MIYVGPDVEVVRGLLESTVAELGGTASIRERLAALAGRVHDGHRERHRGAWVLIRNHHPDLARLSEDDLWEAKFSLADALVVVARDHGFLDWDEVEDTKGLIDPDFERAVDAVISGDRDAIMECFGARPELVQLPSAFGHRATLLHYVAANGVEIRRQIVPQNAIEIAEFLLACGADPRALLRAYGGEYGPLAMLLTSGHPQMACVAQGLEVVLRAVDAI